VFTLPGHEQGLGVPDAQGKRAFQIKLAQEKKAYEVHIFKWLKHKVRANVYVGLGVLAFLLMRNGCH
jgi:hypothetical protein